MKDTDAPPLFTPASGEVVSEVPDGITVSNGFDPKNNLADTAGHPNLVSGDWQNWRPGLKPRGRP